LLLHMAKVQLMVLEVLWNDRSGWMLATGYPLLLVQLRSVLLQSKYPMWML
jgi:hypothetical protein